MGDAVKERLKIPKQLDAGDAMCEECLKMSISALRVCRQCVSKGREFNKAADRLLRETTSK